MELLRVGMGWGKSWGKSGGKSWGKSGGNEPAEPDVLPMDESAPCVCGHIAADHSYDGACGICGCRRFQAPLGQADSKFCMSCGTKMPSAASFCPSCGQKQT